MLYMVYAHFRIFRILKKHSITRERLASRQTETASQRKIGKMLAIVTCIFVTCYFPFVVIRSLKYSNLFNHNMIWRLVQLMIFTQAAVNPVIYCFYNKQFRAVFKDLLKCHWYTIRDRPEMSGGKTRSSSCITPCGTVKLNVVHGSSGQSTPVLRLKDGTKDNAELIMTLNEKMDGNGISYV